jgi:hypothetical protein
MARSCKLCMQPLRRLVVHRLSSDMKFAGMIGPVKTGQRLLGVHAVPSTLVIGEGNNKKYAAALRRIRWKSKSIQPQASTTWKLISRIKRTRKNCKRLKLCHEQTFC